MSGGYIPVFDSVFDGSLAGRWPTLPVWLSILPLADASGEIDMTLPAIAARTGWPIDLLRQGIDELMQADPESRSDAEEGRRLVLLDTRRAWGWRVVNHAYYREMARLGAKAAQEVASGKNRLRMADRRRLAKENIAGDRRGPPPTAEDRLSDGDGDGDGDSDANRDSAKAAAHARARGLKSGNGKHDPDAVALAAQLREYRIAIRDDDWHLRDWIDDGITIGRLIEVIAIARLDRGDDKLWPKVIHAEYINKLARDHAVADPGIYVQWLHRVMRGECKPDEHIRRPACRACGDRMSGDPCSTCGAKA